jgi:SAM-dependent methyltransferase
MSGNRYKEVIKITNAALFPFLLVIPQPILRKIPFFFTNEQIRFHEAMKYMRGYVLDIGCGENRLIQEYRRQGGAGLGVDVFDWGGQDLLIKDTSKLPFPSEIFDAVTMIACINHIPNREKVLMEAHRLLKPDGRLVFTNLNPFLSRIWHQYAFWDRDQNERGMKKGEVYGLKQSEIRMLIEGAHFSIEKRRSFSWGLNTLYVCRKLNS